MAIEILTAKRPLAARVGAVMRAFEESASRAGENIIKTTAYRGRAEWLVLYGVGYPAHSAARRAHVAQGGRVLHFDMPYTMRTRDQLAVRMCIDDDHPQRWLDASPSSGRSLGYALSNTYDPYGHVILVGLGRKSRIHLRDDTWEARTYEKLAGEFPGRKIIYRPKTEDDPVHLPCARVADGAFSELLKGAALVVAHHSNCCIDALVHGVPFRTEDGAAAWVKDLSQRETFLNKLAWWQWRSNEMSAAWCFAKEMANAKT